MGDRERAQMLQKLGFMAGKSQQTLKPVNLAISSSSSELRPALLGPNTLGPADPYPPNVCQIKGPVGVKKYIFCNTLPHARVHALHSPAQLGTPGKKLACARRARDCAIEVKFNSYAVKLYSVQIFYCVFFQTNHSVP